MLPGVMAAIVSGIQHLRITANAVDFDLFAALGSPTAPVFYFVELANNVKLTASGPTVPGWKDDGIHPSSRIILRLPATGAIKGAGGRGGIGGVINTGAFPSEQSYYQAGGGGGAGEAIGGKGFGWPPFGQDGADGSPTSGGSATGTAVLGTLTAIQSQTPPEDGGDAMRISCAYEIYNAGAIWGGGGGGCGGVSIVPSSPNDPTAGGDPGQPGVAGFLAFGSPYQSAGGNAIRLVGSATATFRSGASDPNVKGAVSA